MGGDDLLSQDEANIENEVLEKGTNNEVVIEVDNVIKKFGDLTVLNNVSLRVYRGETLVICGPSGSGKSTLLYCINGLEPIDSGTIKVRGKEVNERSAREISKRIGFVFQAFNLFPHLTVLKNVTIAPIEVLKQPKEEVEQRAKELLKLVGLSDKINSFPRELSGGQQQRVAIARALAMQPEVMLFDEPTSALDPEMIKEVLDVMINLAHQGMTMIVVTHEMGFAREVAHRIAFFEKGKILEIKSPQEFFENPEHESLKRFLEHILRP